MKDKIFKKYLNFKVLGVLILSLLIIIIFKNTFVEALLVLLMIIAAILSIFWKRYTRISFGFELISFVTIIISLAYGPIEGMIIAIISLSLGNMLNQRICMIAMIPLIGCLAAAITSIFMDFTIIHAIILNLIYNITTHLFYIFIMRFRPINSVLAFSTNFILNLYLFISVGNILAGILA